MPHFGVAELAIILVIVLLIFGASRLKDIGTGLGGAISAFRKEVKKGGDQPKKEDEEEEKKTEA